MREPDHPYAIGWRVRIARTLLRLLFRVIFRLLYQVKIEGKEHIPAGGAYLVAHNHVSIIDPPFIISFWPKTLEALGAAEVFSRRGQAAFVRMYGAIPVHRGQFDRKLINTAMDILEAGRPLIIAPEGGRSHVPGLRQAWPGIGYLVEKSGVPVIPVGVTGSTTNGLRQALRLHRPHLTMRIGRPLSLPHSAEDPKAVRAARQTNTDRIMESNRGFAAR